MKRQQGWNSPKEARKGAIEAVSPSTGSNHTKLVQNPAEGLTEAPRAYPIGELYCAYLQLLADKEQTDD